MTRMANALYDVLIGRHAGSRAPFIVRSDAEPMSYDDFVCQVARYAGAITELGLAPGDRLALQAAKSPAALAVYAACVQAGVVFLPLNTAYTAAEVEYFIENSGAALLVCDESRLAALAPIARAHGARVESLNSDGAGSLSDRADRQGPDFATVERGADDLVALLYTSGTTGRSKGAMLTQENLLSNARVLAEAWRFSTHDVLIHALPIFHTHGLFVATNVSLLAGSSMIFLPRFDVEEILARLGDATVMMGVPTFYTRLLNDPRFDREAASGIRLFVSGSAPLLAETHVRFERRTGHRILERYGMTETNMIASNPYHGERRAGTVGFALPGVAVRIRSVKSGENADAGEVGMIQVRGPNVFPGYWNLPERRREDFTDDGFFVTGDLGLIDEAGYLQIVGRGKDLVITGGFNVYPREIEQVLDELDGIAESAVIGVPHPDFGEGVVGVLVPRDGASVDVDAVSESIAARLAAFKRPKRYVVVDELPRNTMGKVQKNVLRDRHRNLFASDAG